MEAGEIKWPDGRVLMTATLKCEHQKRREQAEELDRLLDIYRERLGTIDPRKEDTFAAWKPCLNQPTMLKTEKYAADFPNVHGLLLSGDPGTGKSHLAGSIVWKLRARYVLAIYIKIPRLLDRIRDSYSKDEPLDGIFMAIALAPLVVFDDLGSEKSTDWVEEKIFQLIDSRYDPVKLPSIITTNLKPDELMKKYGGRTAGRLLELCHPFNVLKPDDYRRKIANQPGGRA